ncbi:M56 family metallopeptidase [Amycolatopsis sp. NPDC003861]
MIVSVALLVAALAIGVGAPAVLRQVLAVGVSAASRLWIWLVLVAGFFGTLIAAAVVAVVPGHGPAMQLIGLVHGCWQSLRHGGRPRLEEVVGTISVVVLVGLLGTMLVVFLKHRKRQDVLHRKHVDALSILSRREGGPIHTWWLPLPGVMAYSVAGSPSLIVATEGLALQLSPEQLAAVLEHERAHLRGRHHFLVGLARVLAKVLPWVPLARRSPEFVAAAVELCADAAAASAHGLDTVRAALNRMVGTRERPPMSLAMAEDYVGLRLKHLKAGRRPALRTGCGIVVTFAMGVAPAGMTVLALAVFGAVIPAAILGM